MGRAWVALSGTGGSKCPRILHGLPSDALRHGYHHHVINLFRAICRHSVCLHGVVESVKIPKASHPVMPSVMGAEYDLKTPRCLRSWLARPAGGLVVDGLLVA
eukprot:12400513-Karenia_brevis.AAC.1